MKTAACLCFVLVGLIAGGCAGDPKRLADAEPAPDMARDATAATLGIRVSSLHLSAHGYVLDLRYRVLAPDKAASLLDPRRKVTLVDPQRGARLGVPESPVIGGMRQSARNHAIYTDRDYFILFVNPGRAVRPGETLTLAVDDTPVAQLTVQ
jgi:hypothetical protein